jgi:hypothetical protein
MDFPLYLRTAWRHKRVLAVGLFLSFVLAVLMAMRAQPVWQAQTTVWVTQDGFPWGRAIPNVTAIPSVSPQLPSAANPNEYGPPTADPNRFITLAILYSHLANGDPVKRILLKKGPVYGKYVADPVPSDDGNGYIPFIDFTALAGSKSGSVDLVLRVTNAFRTYLEHQQELNGITQQNRVQVPIVSYPDKPVIVAGKSLTRPVFVFLLAAIATLGMTLAVERIRPSAAPRSPKGSLNGSGRPRAVSTTLDVQTPQRQPVP